MKYLFVFLLLGLVSCGDASSNASENVKPKLKEYSIYEITIPNDTMAFFKYDMKPVTGFVREWYLNGGQVKSECNYKDGKRDGAKRFWYEDGQLKSECNYKDGKRDGAEKGWYEDGQLKSECNYKDGKWDLWKGWNEDGQLQFNYKDGRHAGNTEF
jgi:antitoxin component YwqK of YwqJK toxin-antitoxin module